MIFITASRWLLRDVRRGAYRWLLLAIILASASITFIDQLTHTVRDSLVVSASNSLGADWVIRSSRPLAENWHQNTALTGITRSQSTTLVTMALAKDQFHLIQLRAVSANYPLKGAPQSNSDATHSIPSVWCDPALKNRLGIDIGDPLQLGNTRFTVAGWIENSTPMNAFASQFAPQVMMSIDQLAPLGLTGTGSRVTYEWAYIGDAQTIALLDKAFTQHQQPGWQKLTAHSQNDDLSQTLDMAWLFLDMSALTAMLIAGLAILISSRFYLPNWVAQLSLLRTLGAGQHRLKRILFIQFTWLALLGSLLGSIIGAGLFYAITPLLAEAIPTLSVADYYPSIGLGIMSGTLVFWSFALPTFERIRRQSVQGLLRQGAKTPHQAWVFSFSLMLLMLLLTLLLPIKLIGWTALVLLLVAALLYVLALGLQWSLARLLPITHGWLKLSVANLVRTPALLQLQLMSLGLVLYLLLVMTFVQQQLMQQWQATLPSDSPTVFIINIQPDEKSLVSERLTAAGIQAELTPMVRGRLVAINDRLQTPAQATSDKARRMLDREANIGILAEPPSYNRIMSTLPPSQRQAMPAMSVDSKIADTLAIRLGDVLKFDLQGSLESFQVVSLRQVDWQTLRTNFFFIAEPWTQEPLPISYLTSFYSPLSSHDEESLRAALQQDETGIIWIDLRQMIAVVRDMMSQATTATGFLFSFTLLASLLVLFSAMLAAEETRLRQWLLLRTFGASTATIVRMGLAEFLIVGVLVGVFAAILAQLTSVMISHFWLGLAIEWRTSLWFSSVGLGVLSLVFMGVLVQGNSMAKSAKQLMAALAHDR